MRAALLALPKVTRAHLWEVRSSCSVNSSSIIAGIDTTITVQLLKEVSPLPVKTAVSCTWNSFPSPGLERSR